MKRSSFLYIGLFFLLISPTVFDYEFWPMTRYKLYGTLYDTNQPKFLGLYAQLSDGSEVFLNSGASLYPFFLFHINLNLVNQNPYYEIKPANFNPVATEAKLKALLQVFNFNQTKNKLPLAVKISLYRVVWDQGLAFEQFSETKKLRLLMEVSDVR